MDISKASNFERFVHQLLGGDGARVAELWRRIDTRGEFDLSEGGDREPGDHDPFSRIAEYGFVSGTSRHADRLATIRDAHSRFGVVVDPHTADGLHVAARWREPDVPMVCLETAQPAKFADTIREALGIEPPRPAAYEDIEARAQRFSVMPADLRLLQRYISERCSRAS